MLVWVLTVGPAASFVAAQDEPLQTQTLQAEPVALQSDPAGVPTDLPERFGDPFEAYQAGSFDQALEGLAVEGIQHVGPVHGDECHRIASLEQDRIAHEISLKDRGSGKREERCPRRVER